MSLSAEFSELIPAQPLRLATYLEGRISEIRHDRDLLVDRLPKLLENSPENEEMQDELRATGYWIWRHSIHLVRFERADVLLSRGNPSRAFQMLNDDIADINDYIRQCSLAGCKQTAQTLLGDINQLREITY